MFRPSKQLLPGRLATLLLACSLTSCVAHSHTVGLGAVGGEVVVERQYYWVFGFFQVNDVDVQRLAGDLTSYTVETSFGLTDLMLAPLLLPLTATSRTVRVRT
jgi:hypothetical protein